MEQKWKQFEALIAKLQADLACLGAVVKLDDAQSRSWRAGSPDGGRDTRAARKCDLRERSLGPTSGIADDWRTTPCQSAGVSDHLRELTLIELLLRSDFGARHYLIVILT